MRRLILLTLFAVFALPAPAPQAQEPRIAAGVSAAGTDVSGPHAARGRRPALRTPTPPTSAARSPPTSRASEFLLWPKDVDFTFDVNKSARRAYNAGICAAHRAGQRRRST